MATSHRHPRGIVELGTLLAFAVLVFLLGLGTISRAEEGSAPPPKEEGVVEMDDEYADPRECQGVRRQLKDQLRELGRTEKLLKKQKLAVELETVGQLRGRIAYYQEQFKGAGKCLREALQEFYDEQMWETMNELRAKAELPQQLGQIEKELKRFEKQALKKVKVAGLNPEQFNAHLMGVKNIIAEVRAYLGTGNYQDAQEAMQPIYEGLHPGEIMGVVMRLAEIGQQLKRVKSAEIRAAIIEILQPVIEAANEGDFREANMALNDVHGELMRIIAQLAQSKKYRGDLAQKLEQLEEKIGAKIERTPEAIPEEFLNAPPSVAPVPAPEAVLVPEPIPVPVPVPEQPVPAPAL